jgi:hypothetical protein
MSTRIFSFYKVYIFLQLRLVLLFFHMRKKWVNQRICSHHHRSCNFSSYQQSEKDYFSRLLGKFGIGRHDALRGFHIKCEIIYNRYTRLAIIGIISLAANDKPAT